MATKQKMKKKKIKIKFFCLLGVVGLWLSACNQPYPRLYGYYRIDLTEATYKKSKTDIPCSFDCSTQAKITPNSYQKDQKNWIDISYPKLNANIHCSYKSITPAEFRKITEESRELVYKHTIKAESINERLFENADAHVYGILYDISGNTASPTQFFLTDSVSHFFRGALYFNNLPNFDSIQPVYEFIHKDIIQLIESFSWKN